MPMIENLSATFAVCGLTSLIAALFLAVHIAAKHQKN
ncbi:hypothetical protein J2S36_000855 [Arcanobacterium hippocoleae]|uniref:Uncharacterized protein n=1 Tax=Arcanobacterium hippocoleae TaxID=149017 RepID=A0ABU1T1T2_9ACTO|nr:hypothetical protein [Arcanobacterium hippocoleae]